LPDKPKLVVLPSRPKVERAEAGRLRLWAPAKINLNLLVGARGPDGFHPLDSLVAKIALYDRIDLRPRSDGRITFACQGIDCGGDEQNLALRAARMLAERIAAGSCSAGFQPVASSGHAGTMPAPQSPPVGGADIALVKNIPPGRGLGGGSADAAAVLEGLQRFWNLSLPPQELAGLAARLGSDVPLFLGPAACRMTGRGETVEPIRVHPFWAVLWLPDFACSTAEVYRALDERPEPMGRQLDLSLLESPPSRWSPRLVNQLAAAAQRVAGPLAELMKALARALGLPVHLTGSGSAVFALFDDAQGALAAAKRLAGEELPPCVVVGQNGW